jgi:hypothetical protein
MTSTAADLHQPQVTDADYVQLSRRPEPVRG